MAAILSRPQCVIVTAYTENMVDFDMNYAGHNIFYVTLWSEFNWHDSCQLPGSYLTPEHLQ